MLYRETAARNICTRMGRSRGRRTRHASRGLDRLDASDTNRSAKNSTRGFSLRNRHRNTRCALRPRTERVYPCRVRLDASGTSRSTATGHHVPAFHSTCSIRSLFSPLLVVVYRNTIGQKRGERRRNLYQTTTKLLRKFLAHQFVVVLEWD